MYFKLVISVCLALYFGLNMPMRVDMFLFTNVDSIHI